MIFDKKLKACEILFQNEDALNIHECHFLYHNNNKVKGEVLIVSTSKRDAKGDISMQPEVEPNLDRMV